MKLPKWMMKLPKWISQAFVSGTGGGAVALLVMFFGENYIKHPLDEKLEQVKSEITLHAAKRLKLHDKEFEVFPEIWARLIEARFSLVSAMQPIKNESLLENLTEEEIKRMVESENLTEDECKNPYLRTCYILAIYRRGITKSREIINKFRSYLRKNRIFVNPEIGAKFNEIQLLMEDVWTNMANSAVELEGNSIESWNEAVKLINTDIDSLMKEIEKIIQGELFPEKEPKQS